MQEYRLKVELIILQKLPLDNFPVLCNYSIAHAEGESFDEMISRIRWQAEMPVTSIRLFLCTERDGLSV